MKNEKMKCLNCGAINESNALRCLSCNVLLKGTFAQPNLPQEDHHSSEIICGNCKTSSPSDSLKCNACNAPLSGSLLWQEPSKMHSATKQKICKNCNTHNFNDKQRCSHCNAPLDNYTVPATTTSEQTKKDTHIQIAQEELNICSSCNYPNHISATICSFCNTSLYTNSDYTEQPQTIDHQLDKTINPWIKNEVYRFALVPMTSNNTPNPQNQINYEGKDIVINRENLNIKNTTITAKKQARIYKKDDIWYIVDHSEHKTTFVHAQYPIPLKQGDIIIMGNQKYQFDLD